VSPLAPREQGRVRFWLRLASLVQMHVNPLIAHELQACPSRLSSTPVTPEERLPPDDEWMQQNTDLARLARLAAVPLTLLTQLSNYLSTNRFSMRQCARRGNYLSTEFFLSGFFPVKQRKFQLAVRLGLLLRASRS
jgi:hypothetical protein